MRRTTSRASDDRGHPLLSFFESVMLGERGRAPATDFLRARRVGVGGAVLYSPRKLPRSSDASLEHSLTAGRAGRASS